MKKGVKNCTMTTRNPNSWLSVLASLPLPSRETHLHINSVQAGSGRVFVRLMVHITEMMLLLVVGVGIF